MASLSDHDLSYKSSPPVKKFYLKNNIFLLSLYICHTFLELIGYIMHLANNHDAVQCTNAPPWFITFIYLSIYLFIYLFIYSFI